MKKSCLISWLMFLMIFAFVMPQARAGDQPPLKLIATTPLPELVGDLEFFAPDLRGDRLFLCAENSGTVEVFNLHSGKRLHTIKGFGNPHDIVYLPAQNKLVVSDGGDDFGWAELVDAADYKIVDKIKLPADTDEAVFDPADGYFYIESSSGEPGGKTHLLNIVNTKNFKLVGTISLPGRASEAMAVDHAGNMLYVNNTGTSEVIVVDLRSHNILSKWPLPGATHLNGLALDKANHRVFSATRQPAQFWVLDTDTGKTVATMPCTEFNDHMIFDAARKRIYITGTDKATVIDQKDANHYVKVADVPTAYRAKTSIYIPELNRIYIADSGKDMSGKPLVKPGVQLAMQIYEIQQ